MTAFEVISRPPAVRRDRAPLNVKDFATGDGVTDDYAAIQAVFDVAAAESRAVYFPPGTYRISDTLTLSAGVSIIADQATIDGSGIASQTQLSGRFALRVEGTLGTPVAVTADVTSAASQVAVDTSGFAAGDVVLLTSDQNYTDGATGNYGNRGALHRIQTIDDAGALTLTEPSFFAYSAASTATLTKVDMVTGLVIDGLGVLMGGASDRDHNGILVARALDPIVRRCTVDWCRDTGIQFEMCWGFTAEHNDVRNSPETTGGQTGYGIVPVDACRNGLIRRNRLFNCGDGVDGGGNPVSILITVAENYVEACGNGLSDHEECFWWSFNDNTITGCTGNGIEIRGQHDTASRNTIRDVGSVGIQVRSYDVNSDGLQGARVVDNDIEGTGSGGIYVQGTEDCRVRGGYIAGNRIARSTQNNLTLILADDIEIGPNRYGSISSYSGTGGNNIRIVGVSSSSRCTNIAIRGGRCLDMPVNAILADYTSRLTISDLWVQAPRHGVEMNFCEDVSITGGNIEATGTNSSMGIYAKDTPRLAVSGVVLRGSLTNTASDGVRVSAAAGTANDVTVTGCQMIEFRKAVYIDTANVDYVVVAANVGRTCTSNQKFDALAVTNKSVANNL